MEIQRTLFTNLVAWKDKASRKPLILEGARQVGKTWILKQFGKKSFDHTAYFNFDRQPELKPLFEQTKDPERLLQQLGLIHGKPIQPHTTLVILDEIQECNAALNSLKYFREEKPEFAIACAGSLLGVAMSRGASFPVGSVEFMQMYPVSFSEFLETADRSLFQYLETINNINPIPDLLFSALTDKLKLYYITGGMPESIVTFLESENTEFTEEVLQQILHAYQLDFSKHIDHHDIQKIQYIWTSLPSQLSRENKKFIYRVIKKGARAREYENALLWLINAGLVYRINCATIPGVPLSAYDNLSAFKIYLNDVGLLRQLAHLSPSTVALGNRLFTEFKGALTENYILESLIPQFKKNPRYWKSDNEAEIDFLVQWHDKIIPIEVKSDLNIRSKSLAYYQKRFDPEMSIRFSLRNFSLENKTINIPLFLADKTTAILEYQTGK
jgi:uncharacterized protein